MNRPRVKGTTWESAIVAFLRGRGAAHAERRALAGTSDRGDIAGIPGVVIEAKNCARLELGTWLAEAEAERRNDRARYGAVWIKRRGKTSPGDGYVVLSGDQFAALLAEAGYIPRPAQAEGDAA